MQQVIGKKITELESLETAKKIVVDIGCGDGKWTYELAKKHPELFVVGIDANAKSLEEISHKAARKQAKGGLDNVVYVRAGAESLPHELDSLATQIYINFPWGSLLEGAMNLQEPFLASISRIAAETSYLQLTTTYSKKFEPQMISDLSLPALNSQLAGELFSGWSNYGWEKDGAEWLEVDPDFASSFPSTSWWKQISDNRQRQAWMLNLTK